MGIYSHHGYSIDTRAAGPSRRRILLAGEDRRLLFRQDGPFADECFDLLLSKEYLFADSDEGDLPCLHHPVQGGPADVKIGQDVLDA